MCLHVVSACSEESLADVLILYRWLRLCVDAFILVSAVPAGPDLLCYGRNTWWQCLWHCQEVLCLLVSRISFCAWPWRPGWVSGPVPEDCLNRYTLPVPYAARGYWLCQLAVGGGDETGCLSRRTVTAPEVARLCQVAVPG
jgi:hypothetical protein